jgi:hypothetical protein
LSVAYLLTAVHESDRRQNDITVSGQDEEGFVWSVATVVSLIPYVNWMVRHSCLFRGRARATALDTVVPARRCYTIEPVRRCYTIVS